MLCALEEVGGDEEILSWKIWTISQECFVEDGRCLQLECK